MSGLISHPVKYEPSAQMIVDASNDIICDIRGWGWIQYLENAEEQHDNLGEFIANAINEKLLREK